MTEPKKLNIQMWDILELIPYENNVKKHDKAQVAKIVQSITRFGWDQPIVVDKHGVIIKGHGRRLAAIEMGTKRVPVLMRDDLSPDEVRAARLSDNRAAISDIDPEMLKLEIQSLDMDLGGIFDAKEIDYISSDLGEMNDDIFLTDMGQVLDDQRKETDASMARVTGDDVRVSISKAFGFKDIAASGKLAITRLMAAAEIATGLKNDEALVAWAAKLEQA